MIVECRFPIADCTGVEPVADLRSGADENVANPRHADPSAIGNRQSTLDNHVRSLTPHTSHL